MLYSEKYSTVLEGSSLMRTGLISVAMSLLFLGAPAPAQMSDHQPVACLVAPAALPAELAGWTSPVESAAATEEANAAAVEIVIGQATDLTLAPTPAVKYAVPPKRPAGSVSHGGLAAFQIETAGVYRVAIDSAAWLDILSDGKALESVNHGRGPDCTGIRKMVDFRLEPGIYLMQVVGNGTPTLRVLVTSLPAK
jgi:hypothetical protein